MIHLTPADYARQPWKNGRGVTTELWRLEDNGALLVRISSATVAEDGPFSLFPGIERNLTVTTGRGFRLLGDGIDLSCDPLVPVAFPGDVAVAAVDTGNAPSDDFNVLTARALPRPEVSIWRGGHLPAGGLLALFALGDCLINADRIGRHDLVLTRGAVALSGQSDVITVRLHGLPEGGEI